MSLFGESLLTLMRRQRVVPVALAAVTLLAAVNWALHPDQALRWLGALLFLPATLLVATLWYVWMLRSLRRRGVDDTSSVVRYFGSAVALLFLVIGLRQIVLFGLKIWVELGDHSADLEIERRILGLASSAVLVIIGNALPKILTPLAMLPKERAERVTVARRFIGATLLVFGVAAAFAFLAMPVPFATSVLLYVRIGGLLTILGAIVWMNLGPARQQR